MSHRTVVIFKIENKEQSKGEHEGKFLHLVFFENGKLKFWDYSDTAINGSYNRNRLEKKLSSHFGIIVGQDNIKIGNRVYREYQDEKNPPLTYLPIDIDFETKKKIDNSLSKDGMSAEWLSLAEIEKKISSWEEYQKFIINNPLNGAIIPPPPKFDNSFKHLIEQIQDAQTNDKLVIFVGSGISKNSGIPLWSEVINNIRKISDIPEYEKDYLVIAQLFHNEVGETSYQDTIKRLLKHEEVHPTSIHREIIKLNPKHIITTNYDDILEQVIEDEYKSYSAIKKDSDLPASSTSSYLIKMHGDFEESNIVFKEDDYLNYSSNFPLIENFVKGLFTSSTILFIGFSFTDINLKFILERVRNTLKKDFKPAILFSDETDNNKVSNQKLEYYRKRGIQVVKYKKEIKEYFIKQETWRDTTLKEQGQRVYDFLRFINSYDRHIDSSANSHIVDKMFNALNRFDEIHSVPPQTISKLPPFALIKKEVYRASYDKVGYHLLTMNERIIEFVDTLKIENGSLVYVDNKFKFEKDEDEEKLSASVTDLHEKLHYIFLKLNSSGIRCLQRANYHLGTENHYRIWMPKGKPCFCPRCLVSNLKIDLSLRDLQNGQYLCPISDDNSYEMSLNIALAHFILGDTLSAYNVLKEIGTTCIKKKWFARYFIIQYNIKLLEFAIKRMFNSAEISLDCKNDIVSEIENIDLYDILGDLPLDKLVKEVLEELLSKKWFNSTRRKIEKEIIEVKKVFNIYENNGNRMGYDPYDELLYSYGNLYSFYSANRLFDIAWNDFEELTIKLWDASLYAYRTKGESYNLSNISYYLFDKAVFYIPPKTLEVIFNAHYNPILKSSEKDQTDIINNSISFFNSNNREVNVFGRQIVENTHFEIQKKKYRYFEYRCRNWSGSILLFLANFDFSNIDEVKRNELLESMLNYVLIEGCGMTFDSEYLGEFICNQISLFSNDYIDKIYKSILSDNLWSDRLLKDFCDGLTKEKVKYKISDEALYDLLIKRTSPRIKYNVSIDRIDFIKPFFSKNLQKKFDKLINETK